MNDASSRCPDAEQIAAFVAGSLEGEELTMVAAHVRTCEDCRAIVADVAAIDRLGIGERAAATGQRRRRLRPWLLAVAAAAMAGVLYLAAESPWLHRSDPVSQLVAAAPRDGRSLEPRLAGGFAWAPLRHVPRGGSNDLFPSEMKFIGVAGEVLESTSGQSTAAARHAAAVAHLVAGRPAEAAALLTQLSESAPDAKVWNDLAAAHYALAVQHTQPVHLASALAAADASLNSAPGYPEALFNRALILERLGLRDQARAAWQRYLSADSGSPWAAEARAHLRSLTPQADFRIELERVYDVLARDAGAARAFAAQHPLEARLWGETQILGRWAEALQHGDGEAAARHLRVARSFGEQIAAASGERLLLDEVATIETSTDQTRHLLIGGHLAFRAAQLTFRRGNAAEAQHGFERAAALFGAAHSPCALLARYFFANTRYDQGAIDEARRTLSELLALAPPSYAAHRAQVEWQLGLVHTAGARWGEAIDTLDDSVAIFDRLGERKYAAAVREILSEIYDRIGDPQSAWQNRMIALQVLGTIEDARCEVTVQATARAAALERDWPVSIAFLTVALDMARQGGNEHLAVETLLLLARAHARLGQHDSASADLSRAVRLIDSIPDPGNRERARADYVAVEGFLAPSPSEAIVRLTKALEFHSDRGRRMFLPELLLERGRAFNAVGDASRAAADFESGIHELETQRLAIERGDARWGMFSSSGELFEEAMALALARGDQDGAFAYAERARARELVEGRVQTLHDNPAAVRGAVVVEYASLPARLVIFVVDANGVRTIENAVPRIALRQDSDRLIESARSRDVAQFRQAATTMYARLIAPVASRLDPALPVVFVPDDTLESVPFSALLAPDGTYVVERHVIVVAPSAASFAQRSAASRSGREPMRLLLIAGAAGGDGEEGQLTFAGRETKAVSEAYGANAVVIDRDAASAVLERETATADVIHFVGHAEPPQIGVNAALVTAGGSSGPERLDTHRIATLPLRRCRVIVLAACATARRTPRAGDASMSVARAFLAAGAPSVVATLWPIDDAPAADFFPSLHRRLAGGTPPAEALRATQIEWIHRLGAPPGMWAAVQVIGS